MIKTEDIVYSYSDERNNKLDLYIPEMECIAAFVYFHGGGLECGDKSEIEFVNGIVQKGIAVDEAAPLYHVTHNLNYPPMLFTVSDNDMTNRLEQTKLMIKTLEHFENDMSRIRLKVMENSEHCSYLNTDSEKGNLFEKIVYDFITEH